MISDILAFKKSLLSKPDKWGTPAFNPEEVNNILQKEESKDESINA